MIDNVKVAASYAGERGWEVFPTDRETDALPDDWERRATSDPDAVRRLWTEDHPRGNPALRCGPRSGVLVLEVEPRHGGGLLLDQLEEELGRLPDTLIARTGGGGLHLFFRWVDLGGAVLQPWGPDAGLEVHAGTDEAGAFVWLPPTIRVEHDGEPYEWRNPDAPVAELPDAWVEAILGEREVPELPTAEQRAPGRKKRDQREGDRREPRERAEPRRAEPFPKREETAPVWTAGDLAMALREDASVERTSPMLLWKHSMTYFFGTWGSGKSTVLASDLAAVVEEGLEGERERRVLWISEMPKGQTARYVANAGLDASGLTEAGERGLLQVIGLRGSPHRSWGGLERQIADFDPDVIYVDTLGALVDRFAEGGAPDRSETAKWQRLWDTRFADWASRWAHEGLVAVDRTLEADPERLPGSGGRGAGADVLLCLLPPGAHGSDVREIQVVGGRGVRAGRKTYARFERSGRYGRYVPVTDEEARKIERRESEADPEDEARPYIRIVEAVDANPGSLSSELYTRVRGREKAFRTIRDRLVDWNLIEDRSGPDDRGHSWYVVEGVDPDQARETILEELRARSP